MKLDISENFMSKIMHHSKQNLSQNEYNSIKFNFAILK